MGTGMKAAADCNNIKACFPVAVIYSVVDGTTSRGVSDNLWIQMCVRELAMNQQYSYRLGICREKTTPGETPVRHSS